MRSRAWKEITGIGREKTREDEKDEENKNDKKATERIRRNKKNDCVKVN